MGSFYLYDRKVCVNKGVQGTHVVSAETITVQFLTQTSCKVERGKAEGANKASYAELVLCIFIITSSGGVSSARSL